MRRIALAASLLSLPLLVTATGCWPGIPIAAIAAAASGGGGGGGGNPNNVVQLTGHIVTDPSGFATAAGADREPNDRLGLAYDVGPIRRGTPARVAGTAATTATLHALVDDGSHRSIVARELLSTGGSTCTAGSGSAGEPIAVARIDRELFLLDRATMDGNGNGAATQIRVTPIGSGFVKRRFALEDGIAAVGFTALLDSLLVLERASGTTRLLALDATDARPLFASDLGMPGLSHLAGAEELSSGRPRLFTSSGDRVFEVAIARVGRDRRFERVELAFAPAGLSGGIAALAYDGALVHVVDGDGTLRSFEPNGREVASRRLVGSGTRVLSLAAHLDLGLDGYHFEVGAGERFAVDLATTGLDDATLFAFALSRSDLENERAGPPAFFTEFAAGTRRAVIDNSAAATPVEFDLVIGARAGAGRYAVALGGGLAAREPTTPPDGRDDDARALARYLDAEVFAKLPTSRIVEIYRDPLLPDFDPGRIVLGRTDRATALSVPSPSGFELTRTSRSPGGFEVWAHLPDASWQGPRAATLHGNAPRASTRREESRRTLALLARLAGTSGVAWREPVMRAHALAGPVTPDDTQFQAQKWAFDEMKVREAWNSTTGDASNVLAIVDTGIRTDNSDLIGNFNGDGYDFITDVANAADGDGIDPDPFDEGTFGSNSQHGSHCAGTIGCKGNNSLGLAGINWDCTLMAVRALGIDGSGSTVDIAEGILYAARLANASGTVPSSAARVINLSLGTPFQSNAIHNAINAAIGQGCVICCAAGNDGNGAAVLFPAAHPESIAVAACDIDENIADYSNTGPELDVTAPGGSGKGTDKNSDGFVDDVWSTIGNDQIAALPGTSMACSQASGVCGLIKVIDPTITQAQMIALLTGTAKDLDVVGFDDFSGFGLVDAQAALVGATPLMLLSATEVDLGETGNRTLIQAQNSGGGALTIGVMTQTPILGPGGWLTTTLQADGKTIELEADRTGLAGGDHQIQVDITSNGGTGSFLVDLTQGAGTGPTDVGAVTIQLFAFNETTLAETLVTSVIVTAANGYAFTLPKVPHGTYLLKAGTDVDHDGVLGEVGELFGAYPKGATPTVLELDRLNDFSIDFVVK